MSTASRDDLSLPHYSASEFASEKRLHRTEIRNSPPRYRTTKQQHPYEANQPIDPHYSQATFDKEKRVHMTDIRESPRRARQPPKTYGRVEMAGPPYHTSQQELAIEKTEHMTPIFPVQEATKPEPRSPEHFRHKSCSQFAAEIARCKTPVYPCTEIAPAHQRVVDNYLNFTPHKEGFMQRSNKIMAREKSGHLTAIHNAKPTSPPPKPQLKDEHGLFKSAHDLATAKSRHNSELHTSPHRARARSSNSVDRSPLYSSAGKFSSDKQRHRATISCSPHRTSRNPEPMPKGYNSHRQYSTEKRRHAASPEPIQRAVKTSQPPDGDQCVHVSHTGFVAEKRRHATDILNSPRRGAAPPATARSSSANYSSRRELERAKRGHHISLGGGSAVPTTSQRRTHSSCEQFTSEKRGHHTGIGNVHTPPSPALTPPHTSFKSFGRFCDSKRSHKAEINTSVPRATPHKKPSVSPGRMTSHNLFEMEKARHAFEIDSPQRQHETPQTPPTLRQRSHSNASMQSRSRSSIFSS